ncbi:hypothetical protein DS884_05730 [Tenacibaculum sp. E3R01]|uniref:hypothetical protein n=1 Tax=Tenacibaculum sp. E3R01 TaxID=2267227 RepID=UPI000DE97854|nr:hypothetical protein [Tenacibaculum sp. E3R01]RBW59239.1 hypothetical protein DS884_05730 [Tenacibaculum sp. E3R01]
MEKKLKNIASGLLNSFISRNNDVNGYWGIGKLYSLMIQNNCFEIKIDLLAKTMIPENAKFTPLITRFNKKFKNKIAKIDLCVNEISSVYILLHKKEKIDSDNYKLTPLLCSIKVNYKKNIEYHLEVMCRKHNPKLESKSCRNYSI